MYLPYLRGRQYELLALRDLVENRLIGKHILPIIEPIKPTSTLVKTLAKYCNANKRISFIHNPRVGNFLVDMNEADPKIKDNLSYLYKNTYLLNSLITCDTLAIKIDELLTLGINKSNILLINNNRDYITTYNKIFSVEKPAYNLIPDESAFRRQIRDNRVILDDKFTKKVKNADYLNNPDEFFSDDHLYYREDGYKGFSDYTVIGSDFSESGFAPFAVAIHIVYFDAENKLRIRHFVSDSNDDWNDPANKYYQALSKLAEWKKKININTLGLNQFMENYEKGTYPGLGTVKKLAIMHHIELMSKYLDGVYE